MVRVPSQTAQGRRKHKTQCWILPPYLASVSVEMQFIFGVPSPSPRSQPSLKQQAPAQIFTIETGMSIFLDPKHANAIPNPHHATVHCNLSAASWMASCC